MKNKIVVTCPMGLSPEQKARLEKLGEVTYYDTHPSVEEWLERAKGHDIVCSWIGGLREKYGELRDTFISVPFVGVSSFADPAIVKANNLTISNSPGCNRHAVSEWIIYMMLSATRHISDYVNVQDPVAVPLENPSIGLAGKHITILGKGSVGSRVGAICEALEMKVAYFTRDGDLRASVKDADIVVDALSANPISRGLLGKDFFAAIKDGAIFISVTVDSIVDIDAMLAALETGKLSRVAHDVMNAKLGDAHDPLYDRLRRHPRVLATPHIAAFTDVTTTIGNDMMIDNIEAWLKGKPIHVFG